MDEIKFDREEFKSMSREEQINFINESISSILNSLKKEM